jgi:hypothetical protein
MEKHYEAVVEPDGLIHLDAPGYMEKGFRNLFIIPQTNLDTAVSGIALSEPSLSADWNNSEEDEAWSHLQ